MVKFLAPVPAQFDEVIRITLAGASIEEPLTDDTLIGYHNSLLLATTRIPFIASLVAEYLMSQAIAIEYFSKKNHCVQGQLIWCSQVTGCLWSLAFFRVFPQYTAGEGKVLDLRPLNAAIEDRDSAAQAVLIGDVRRNLSAIVPIVDRLKRLFSEVSVDTDRHWDLVAVPLHTVAETFSHAAEAQQFAKKFRL